MYIYVSNFLTYRTPAKILARDSKTYVSWFLKHEPKKNHFEVMKWVGGERKRGKSFTHVKHKTKNKSKYNTNLYHKPDFYFSEIILILFVFAFPFKQVYTKLSNY